MRIKNLTQHPATPEQLAEGVIDFVGEEKKRLVALLNFETQPTRDEIKSRAEALALLAGDTDACVIGGAPFLMSSLETELAKRGINSLYSFSVRVSSETMDNDGRVTKTNSFKHIGFIKIDSDELE